MKNVIYKTNNKIEDKMKQYENERYLESLESQKSKQQ